jgi:alcohol dehydrogenase class IV
MLKRFFDRHRSSCEKEGEKMSDLRENLPVMRINEFQNPQKMVFGIGTVEKAGDEATRLGAGRVFVVSDENIEKVGILGKVLESLRAKALDVQVYKISAAEPTIASAEAVASAVRGEKADVVVGVGGGSCLDSAKIAAMMATNPGNVQGYCARVKGTVKAVGKDTLPKILIPTTAGTGSEASNTLVIIEGDYKTWITDNRMLADVAIVDPALTVTLPPRLTAGTGVDALSHVVEALMSVQANALSDALSLAAVKLIFTSLRTAYHHGENLEARRNLSLAATLGGWVIGFPWIGGPATIGHCIAEAVGSKYKIPHGVACGIALPYAMGYNLPLLIDKLGTVATAMDVETANLTKREAACTSIDATFELMEDIDMPLCLREVGVPEADLKPLAEYIIEERQYLYGLSDYNPRRPTLRNITQLLEQMWLGEAEED